MKNINLKKLLSLLMTVIIVFATIGIIPVNASARPASTLIFNDLNCPEVYFLTRTLRGNFGMQGFEGEHALGNDPDAPVIIYVQFTIPSAVALYLLQERGQPTSHMVSANAVGLQRTAPQLQMAGNLTEADFEVQSLSAHTAFHQQLNSIPTPFSRTSQEVEILAQFYSLFNGVIMRVPTSMVAQIAALPEVFVVTPYVAATPPGYGLIHEAASTVNNMPEGLMPATRASLGIQRIHDSGITGDGVRVAMLDTGIYSNHPAFNHPERGSVLYAGDDIPWTPNYHNSHERPYFDEPGYHGSRTAGALVSMAPDITLLSIKRGSSGTEGQDHAYHHDALRLARDWGADVIYTWHNFANHPFCPHASDVTTTVLAGHVVVTAVHNQGPYPFSLWTPSTSPLAISVGAGSHGGSTTGPDTTYRHRDTVVGFSGRGPVGQTYHIKPDILALGVNDRSAIGGDEGFGRFSGTSMSGPIVAGIAALMVQDARDRYGTFNPTEIKATLMNTARPINPNPAVSRYMSRYCVFSAGAGFVNPADALRLNDGAFATATHPVIIPHPEEGGFPPFFNLPWPMASLSFGAINVNNARGNSREMEITIHRPGDEMWTPYVTFNGNRAGVNLNILSNEPFPGAPYADAIHFTARLTFDNTAQSGIYQGQIRFANGTRRITMPFAVVVYNEIYTAQDFDNIRNNLGGIHRIMDDIDFSGFNNWIPIGTSATPFTGMVMGYSGNTFYNRTISNLNINRNAADTGLFGVSSGFITSLTVNAGVISGANNTGILVGNNSGTINNVTVSATEVRGANSIGGLIGSNTGQIANAHVYGIGMLIGSAQTGGLVGQSAEGNARISNSTVQNIAEIRGTNSTGGLVGSNASRIRYSRVDGINVLAGNSQVGGLVGQNISTFTSTASIESSAAVNIGSITGSFNNTGGFAGSNNGNIYRSYAQNNVRGNSGVGGFVGMQSGGEIEHSFATGNVLGNSQSGGFVGNMLSGTIRNTFATGNVTIGTTNAGFAGVMGMVTRIENSYSLSNNPNGFTTSNRILESSFFEIDRLGWVFDSAAAMFAQMDSLLEFELELEIDSTHHDLLEAETAYYAFDTSFDTSFAAPFDISYEAAFMQIDNLQAVVAAQSSNPMARTSEQMRMQETFEGWDFVSIWEMHPGQYPMLRAMHQPIINTEFIPIYTLVDFNYIYSNLFGNFRLMADIDLSGINWTPIGTVAEPFRGILDGNGHTIYGINVNFTNAQDNAGFFGINSGTVSNLTIANASVTGRTNIGALAGQNHGSIANVTIVNATVQGATNVGGLVGRSSNTSRIYNGSVVGDTRVTGTAAIGGLVGDNHGRIANASTEGLAEVRGSGGNIGGLVGNNLGTTAVITNSHSSNITNLFGNHNVGGLAGANNGTIRLSYSTNNVTASGQTAGGFVGITTSGIIEQSYATGAVSGAGVVGGFAGRIDNAIIRNSFALGNVAASATSAGFVGDISHANARIENSYAISNSANGFATGDRGIIENSFFQLDALGIIDTMCPHARTAGEMRMPYTFEGWDFDTVWMMSGTPMLQRLRVAAERSFIPIHTAEDLYNMGNNVGRNYRLMADIDLSGISWTPVGTRTHPFVGVLDGNGRTIHNLNINAQDNAGLFGVNRGIIANLDMHGVTANTSHVHVGSLAGVSYGHISNITATNVLIHGSARVSGLIGQNDGNITDAEVYNIEIRGSGGAIGGLVGTNNGRIERTLAHGGFGVTGGNTIGGLVGDNNGIIAYSSAMDMAEVRSIGIGTAGGLVGSNGRTISLISNSRSVNIANLSGSRNVGGLVGSNGSGSGGTIYRSYSTNDVHATDRTGGLVGNMGGGLISLSYATGSVSAHGMAGGLVGDMTSGTIEQSYATGSVSGNLSGVGGFIGRIHSMGAVTIRNSFATGSVLEISTSNAGFAGNIFVNTAIQNSSIRIENSFTTSHHVNGLFTGGQGAVVINSFFEFDESSLANPYCPHARTDWEMRRISTFEGWDFENIWEMHGSSNPPVLRGLPVPIFRLWMPLELPLELPLEPVVNEPVLEYEPEPEPETLEPNPEPEYPDTPEYEPEDGDKPVYEPECDN